MTRPTVPTVRGRWMRWLRTSLRSVAGHDLFLSYSHEDGVPYATELAEQLEQRGFIPFSDLLDTHPGTEISENVQGPLRGASMLLLICTPAAARSTAIRSELELFRASGRRHRVIGQHAVMKDAVWFDLNGGVAHIETDPLQPPTDDVINQVVRAFRYAPRRRVRRIVLWSAILLTLALLLIAAFSLSTALTAADDAWSSAITAEVRRAEAEGLRRQALHEREQALLEREQARREREEAAAQAARERNRAIARSFATRAVTLAARPQIRARAPLTAALESLRHDSTPEALEVAQQFTPMIPRLVRSIRFRSSVKRVAISSSGAWYAVAADSSVLLYSRQGLRWRSDATNVTWLAISPDESSLAYVAEGEIHVVSLRDVEQSRGAAATSVGGNVSHRARPFFSRDGQSVILVDSDSEFHVPTTTVFSLDEPRARYFDFEALDANGRWIVGRTPPLEPTDIIMIPRQTRTPEPSTPDVLVLYDRREDVETEISFDDRVQQALIVGDFLVTNHLPNPSASKVIGTVRRASLREGLSSSAPIFDQPGTIHVAAADEAVLVLIHGESMSAIRVDTGQRMWTEEVGFVFRIHANAHSAWHIGAHGIAFTFDLVSGKEQYRFFAGQHAEFSRDGTAMITADGNVVRLWDALTDSPAKRIPTRTHRLAGSLGANDRYGISGTLPLEIRETPGGHILRPRDDDFDPKNDRLGHVAFSQDQRWVAAVIENSGIDARILLIRTADGTIHTTIPTPLERVQTVALSQHGEFVAAHADKRSWIYSVAEDRDVFETRDPIGYVTFAPDRSTAAYLNGLEIVLVDLRHGRVTVRVALDDDSPRQLHFRGDSAQFFVTARGRFDPADMLLSKTRAVHVFDRSGRRVAHVLSPWSILDAAWAGPKTLHVATGGSTVRTLTWDAESVFKSGCTALLWDDAPFDEETSNLIGSDLASATPCRTAVKRSAAESTK